MGDWKLIENYESGELELYHLRDDIGEKHNLAQIQPERADKMRDALRAWRKQVDANMPRPNPEYVPSK
jgi:uncharacterized sulfatase